MSLRRTETGVYSNSVKLNTLTSEYQKLSSQHKIRRQANDFIVPKPTK